MMNRIQKYNRAFWGALMLYVISYFLPYRGNPFYVLIYHVLRLDKSNNREGVIYGMMVISILISIVFLTIGYFQKIDKPKYKIGLFTFLFIPTSIILIFYFLTPYHIGINDFPFILNFVLPLIMYGVYIRKMGTIESNELTVKAFLNKYKIQACNIVFSSTLILGIALFLFMWSGLGAIYMIYSMSFDYIVAAEWDMKLLAVLALLVPTVGFIVVLISYYLLPKMISYSRGIRNALILLLVVPSVLNFFLDTGLLVNSIKLNSGSFYAWLFVPIILFVVYLFKVKYIKELESDESLSEHLIDNE